MQRAMPPLPRSRRRGRPSLRSGVLFLLVESAGVLTLLGCKDLTGSTALPAGVENPTYYSTPAGALGMATAALYAVETALPGYIVDTGLLTDELESNETGVPQSLTGSGLPASGSLDERILPEQAYGASGTADQDFNDLNQARGLIAQALGALATYDTGAVKQGDPVAMRSELYALDGYAEILLADFFCSGIPLSTLDFQKDYTYRPGSPTDSVYRDAIGKLDTAYTLASASDSAGLQNLALVLKGRAWLDLGQYDSAAAAVANVAEGFQDTLTLENPNFATKNYQLIWLDDSATVSDGEGENGVTFLSSGDPRTTGVTNVITFAQNTYSLTVTFPAKYTAALSGLGYFPFTIADWVEARLIQAEVALHQAPNDLTWLTILNTLRATAPIPGTTQPATAQQLPPLTDPGAALSGTAATAARLSLLFQERAYWLFLTGHRQGDLRRLIRQYGPYGFSQQTVYPTGLYLAPGTGQYGTDVTAPIPGSEYANPQFHGCLNRNA
jgi:hypothetical protein